MKTKEEIIEEAIIKAAIHENVIKGDMEVVDINEGGEPLYRMTEQGNAKVREMLKENPRLFIEMGLDKGHH